MNCVDKLKGRIILYDIDSKIPNLALMRLSTFYKKKGFHVVLCKNIKYIKAEKYFASTVFYIKKSQDKIAALRNIYQEKIKIGGSGICLKKRLPPEVESCPPDYQLYNHKKYALGFLTRGCDKRCKFCLVPRKEGKIKSVSASFADFVPYGQNNVMLLDDNLLASPDAEKFLIEMIDRKYAINFSQSLDITYVDEYFCKLLKKIDSRNSRFTKPMIYFSCNNIKVIKQFESKKDILKSFGKDRVSVITMFGFDTSLSGDYKRFIMLRKLMLIPFFQEYLPIPGIPAQFPDNFFDMDINEVIRLTFRSNGQNWEKYLRWLNRLYFRTYGRYYLPLIKIIYRYNNKSAINKYLTKPNLLTTVLYRS